MKLIEMKCENCGADLEVDSELTEVNCKYCHTTFKVDDESKKIKIDDMEQAGYEFEKGKLRAQREHREQQFKAFCDTKTNYKIDPLAEFLITFFLGYLGVHKFIKGQIGMGILYFFTLGLFGIGWLYDIIMAVIKLVNTSQY